MKLPETGCPVELSAFFKASLSVLVMASENPLSKEETQIYDRQLRLWGVQSQQRLQQSKVALIGLNAVLSEIAKNIILAGLNELTIFDWVTVKPRHTIPHLFLDPRTAVGQNVRAISVYPLATLLYLF